MILVMDLRAHEQQFQEAGLEARGLLRGLSDAQFNWQPEPGQWSMAQCILHLTVSAGRALAAIDAAAERARSQGFLSPGPFRYGALGNWIVRMAEPPPKIRFKAPRGFAPQPQAPLAETLAEFINRQSELMDRVRRCEGLDLARIKVPIPAISLVKLSLGHYFGLVAAHERRHLWQARQVRLRPGFPA